MRLITMIWFCLMGSWAHALPVTPEQIRELVLDRKIHELETEMRAAHDAFKAKGTDADHLRDLNMVFVTTSPKIRDTAEEWLERYPDSPYAMMANAWIADKIAWTIRGTGYASTVYHEAWPAYHSASERSLKLSLQAFETDASYLPASDGLIKQATAKNYAVSPELIVHSVMAKSPNAGTLIRGLMVAHPGWGGSHKDGEKMCKSHAHKVEAWGDQAFDICMIHMSFHYTGWQPMRDFAERLLRTDHPSVLEIRRKVVVKTNFYYPGWYETVSQLDFPKEEWRQDIIKLVNSDDFDDLEFAIEYDSRFAGYTDLEMVTDKVRPRARAAAKIVLSYDPYNSDATSTLGNNLAFERQADGFSATVIRDQINTAEELFDLQKRMTGASPWSASSWAALMRHFVYSPRDLDDFQTAQELAANAVVYSNHSANHLREYLEEFRSFLRPYQIIKNGEKYDQFAWMKNIDETSDLYCPIARAKVMYQQVCSENKGSRSRYSRCDEKLFQEDLIDEIVEKMRSNSACILSQTNQFSDLMFTPVDIDVMSLNPY